MRSFKLIYSSKSCRVGLVYFSALCFLSACSTENETSPESPTVSSNVSAPSESADLSEIPRVNVRRSPASARTTANASQETTLTESDNLPVINDLPVTTASDVTTGPRIIPDVGIEGLRASMGNIQRDLTPYFTDRSKYLSPDVSRQLTRQTSAYMSELKNAKSVDKEVRHEIWDLSIDLHAAIGEMADTPAGPRYEELRGLTQRRLQEIQAIMLRQQPQ